MYTAVLCVYVCRGWGGCSLIKIWPSCCFYVPRCAQNVKAARGWDLNQTRGGWGREKLLYVVQGFCVISLSSFVMKLSFCTFFQIINTRMAFALPRNWPMTLCRMRTVQSPQRSLMYSYYCCDAGPLLRQRISGPPMAVVWVPLNHHTHIM